MKKFCLFIVSIFLFNTLCFAQIKTFTKQGESVVQKDQSVNQVISYLKQKLTREAQEEAGTFITTNLKIENYQITKDEFTSFAGSISKTTVLEEMPFMKDKEQYVKVKIKVDIDTDNVKAYLEKIMQDNEYKEQAQKAIKEAEELKKKNLELENKLKTATKQEYEQKLSLQAEQQIQEQKQREIELNKMALQAKEEYTKIKEEQLQLQQKREQKILKLKEKIAQEKDNVKKAELENQAKIKELELKAKENQQDWNTNTNKISIQQAIQEATKVKQETAEIINKFETLIKENKEKITKSYDEQIQLSCNTNPKDQWETEEEYNTRLEKNKQIKEKLEREKEEIIFEKQRKILESMVTTIKPFVEKLQYFQTGKFYDRDNSKAKLISIEEINVDKQYFVMNVEYTNKTYSLKYDFSKIGRDKAKLMCQTEKQFVIEPNFSINNIISYYDILKSFTINNNFYEVEQIDVSNNINEFPKNISVENFDSYNKIFTIIFQYANKQYNINFDFSKIQEKEAKKLYKNPKNIKIIPNIYKEETIGEPKKELVSFNIKHLGLNIEQNIDIDIDIEKSVFIEIRHAYMYETILDNMNFIKNSDKYLENIINFCEPYKKYFKYGHIQNLGLNALKVKQLSKYYKLQNFESFKTFMDSFNNINNLIKQIYVGQAHTVGLKLNGTVVAVGNNEYGQCNVEDWKDIVQIAVGYNHTVGLKKDGTVVAVGDNFDGQCNVKNWKNIVLLDVGENYTIGYKKDGTSFSVGCSFTSLDEQEQAQIKKWDDIDYKVFGETHVLGLKKDGTVVAVGSEKICFDDSFHNNSVQNWKNIVQIAVGYRHSIGLQNNGDVLIVGDIGQYVNSYDVAKLEHIKYWKDVVVIADCYKHVVAIKKDGTIITAGDNEYGQCNVEDWSIKIPE